MIPPTPESDISTHSPQSSHMVCETMPSSASSQAAQPGPPPQPPQKRKAGRKPLYKTAQERRERNRKAQLAFRSRRSDYLAQLEATCRQLEDVVKELQDSNKMANDTLRRQNQRVKYLETMLQNVVSATNHQQHRDAQAQQQSPMQLPMPTYSPVTSPTSTMVMTPPQQTQQLFRVSVPTLRTLLSLEQQMSSCSQSHQNPFFAPENYIGMFPYPIFELLVLVVWV
jgi:hypothetical protein